MNVSSIDIAVIIIYLVGITAFGIWVGYRKHSTTEQYFLAGHSLNWFTVGAAIFTSNISTIHLVGLAAGGAKDGMVIGNFEWMACFTLILLALLFTPFVPAPASERCLNSWIAATAQLPEHFWRSLASWGRC